MNSSVWGFGALWHSIGHSLQFYMDSSKVILLPTIATADRFPEPSEGVAKHRHLSARMNCRTVCPAAMVAALSPVIHTELTSPQVLLIPNSRPGLSDQSSAGAVASRILQRLLKAASLQPDIPGSPLGSSVFLSPGLLQLPLPLQSKEGLGTVRRWQSSTHSFRFTRDPDPEKDAND